MPVVTAGARLLAALLRGERESGARLHERAVARDAGPSFALAETKRVTLTVGATVTREDTFNVVASVEGADPVLRSEFIALGAHLDHIGLRAARRGIEQRQTADSVGDSRTSSTTAPTTTGRAWWRWWRWPRRRCRGPRPKRSLLFVWHTGEESGGWGAQYVTAFPPVPIDRIVAQLNLDMIGRSRRAGDQTPANHALTGPDEVYLVGASRLSRALADTVARVNRAIPESHAEPEVRRPGRPGTHLRAERPLPVRAEAHPRGVLLQRPARGLPPALRRGRPHRLREAPEGRANRPGRGLGAGQCPRSSGPRHAARCADQTRDTRDTRQSATSQ